MQRFIRFLCSVLIVSFAVGIFFLGGVYCAAATLIDVGLEFIVEPEDVVVRKNDSIILNCSAETLAKFEPLVISWTHNGDVVTDDRRVVFRNGSLYIKRVTHTKKSGLSDLGRYECVATNRIGAIASRGANLQIASLSRVTSDFQPVKAEVGGVLRLVCNITGFPDPVIVWEFNRLALQPRNSKRHVQLPSGVLQIYNLRKSDSGIYRCKAFNIANQRSREISVSISDNNTNIQPRAPKIVAGPQNLTLSAGSTATLECLVSGYPSPTVNWTRQDGHPVRGHLYGQGNLNIFAVSARDAGGYTCHAEVPGIMKEVQSTAFVNVISPPVIRYALTSQKQITGGTVRFDCQIESVVPPPRIRWLKNNRAIKINGRMTKTFDSILMVSQLDKSDTGYYQCVASNAAGETKSAARLEVFKHDHAPKAPVNLTATTLSSTSVYLEWESDDGNAQPVIAYSIHYRHHAGTRVVEEQRVVPLGPHTVVGLQPFTNYSFYVVAYTPGGVSERSQEVVQQTAEALPIDGPPVTLTTMSPTTIKVTWGELPPQKAQGVITGYKVIYRRHDESSEMVASIEAREREHIIHNLEPDTSYDVRVIAGNKIGYPDLDEKKLPWVTEWTPSHSTPGAPQVPELLLTAINTTSVVAGWTPRGGRIIGYKLYHTLIGTEETVGPIVLSNATFRYQVDDLTVNTWYEFGLLAYNRFGESQRVVESVKTKSLVVNDTTKEEEEPELLPPPAPIRLRGKPLSSSQILLQWNMPQHLYPITNYTIQFCPVTPNENIKESYEESTAPRHVFHNLRSYTLYEFSVLANSQGIPGPFSKKVRVRTKEGIPSPPIGLSCEVLKPGRVRLNWRPPKNANGVIVSYIIMYNIDKDQPEIFWLKKVQNGSSTSVLLEDLDINKPYYIKLRAQTSAGEGPATPIIEVKMCGGSLCRPPIQGPMERNISSVTRNTSALTPTGDSNIGTGDKMTGVIIGVSIGVGCIIIICIIIISLWNRCCLPVAKPASLSHCAGSCQRSVNGESGQPDYHELERCSLATSNFDPVECES